MNTTRSYLDNLNTGRQRRAGTALDEINQTLEQLESRLEQAFARRERQTNEDDIARRMERLSTQAGERRAMSQSGAGDSLSLQRGERFANGVNIAGELRTMREDMQAALEAGIRREFVTLREELARFAPASQSDALDDRLRAEFQNLSEAISQLSERTDEGSIKMLQRELSQLKGSLANLAREESVQALDERWEGFQSRFQLGTSDPAINRLAARLEEISTAVHNLPESLSLRSLEERVRTLAKALEQFAVRGDRNQPDLYTTVEERLDEISRAIAASAARAHAPSFDNSVLDRIEARISSLAKQLDEVVQDQPGGMIVERLNGLSERVEEVARRIEVPEQVVSRLAGHLSRISERIDTAPAQQETDLLFQGFDSRFARLSELVERRQEDAILHGQALFQDLERRLEEVAERLDRQSAGYGESGIMSAMEDRFAELAARIERSGNTSALRSLEERLEDISGRLQNAIPESPHVDPEVFRSLEAQVANLAARLAAPGHEGAAEIAPRLDNIERSIDESRAAILETARQAAEEAVEKLTTSAGETTDGRLKEEIEKLHSLTRKSDERNTKTFEAIHDTLLKIVDRLGVLEAGADPDGERIAVSQTPSLDHAEPSPRLTPAEAAAAAAEAALMDDDPDASGQPERRTVLGGLSRALSGRRASEAEEAGREEPLLAAGQVDEDEAFADERLNEPLEPGSGAPDLNAIMRRVRDERSMREQASDEAARADFIAAARRAAQAAAAEAEILKDRRADHGEKGGRSALGRVISRHRRKLLSLTAVIIVAGSLPLAWWMLEERASRQTVRADGPAQEERATSDMGEAAIEPEDTGSHASASAREEQPGDAMHTAQEATLDRSTTASTAAQPIAASASVTPTEKETPASLSPGKEAVLPSQAPTPAVPDEPAAAPSALEPARTSIPDVPNEIGPEPLRKAAADGASKALYEVASRYARGYGVDADMAKAAKFYELAAEQGLAPAQYRIGNLYEKGTGVEQDIEKAKMWYQLAAEQGNASAMHNLGVLYAMGADGVADNETAARWFKKAAQLGVTDSQFNLGILSAKGVGVSRDLVEAYKWFDIVARAGDEDAAAKRDEIAQIMAPADLANARGRAKLWKARQAHPETNVVDIPETWMGGAAITTGSVDTAKAVRNIQLILNQNGFDAGPADGVLGEKTRSAIRAFQAANEMTETGEINDALVSALLEANENAQ